jgi:hypothetical protein
MDNIVEELQDIYDQLQSFVDKASKNKAILSLEKLELTASEIGKSWSGSWIGYQSRVYYKDFIVPPAGAHFSSEWGFYENARQDTRGAWTEYQFDQVQEHIRTKAGNPDTKQANDASKLGRDLFREKHDALLSILETYLLRRKDSFVESLVEKIKPMKIPAGSDWIASVVPHTIVYLAS